MEFRCPRELEAVLGHWPRATKPLGWRPASGQWAPVQWREGPLTARACQLRVVIGENVTTTSCGVLPTGPSVARPFILIPSGLKPSEQMDGLEGENSVAR